MLPKTTIEQRARFYEDVESLLSPGFLTHLVTVAGVRLQIRSLSSGDLFLLRARTDGTTLREWRTWAVASAIWMIDGRVVLGQDDAIPFLMPYVSRMSNTLLGILFSTLLGLWVRVGDAIEDIEAFNYESVSRYKWKSINKRILDSGVPGAERLGLNTVQRIWMAFNEMEDSRQADVTAWEGSKLVASSNAPKAVAKIDEKDRQRRRDELEMRQRRMDQFFYQKIRLLKSTGDAQATAVNSSYRLATKSVEDLEDEMRRWVAGDADLHDQVVTDYKNRIRLQKAQDEADLAERQQLLMAERARLAAEATEVDFRPQPLLALSAAQLQQMLQGRGDGGGHTTFIPKAPHADRLYHKYLAEGAITTGDLQVQGDKVLDPEADPEVDARTLNELIKGRSPTFGSGGE